MTSWLELWLDQSYENQDVDLLALSAAYTTLEHQGTRALEQDGFTGADRRLVRSAELRYQGQEHTVNISIPGHTLTPSDLAQIIKAFNEAHRIQYGHRTDDPIEIVTLRLRALLPRPQLPKIAAGTGRIDTAQKGNRPVYQSNLGQALDYAVHDRRQLRGADQTLGPAIIEEPTSTTILHTADEMAVGGYGELVIQIGGNM